MTYLDKPTDVAVERQRKRNNERWRRDDELAVRYDRVPGVR